MLVGLFISYFVLPFTIKYHLVNSHKLSKVLDKIYLRVYNINGGESMARRAKGEGSIYKDKQGYWNAQIIIGYQDGKPKYKKFRSKKQGVVVEKLNTYKMSIGSISPEVVSDSSLDSLLDVYMILKKDSVRPTSFDSLKVTRNLVSERLGYYSINDLSSELIQKELISKMCNTHAYSTIHKAYVLLNECLNFAVDKDYILKNPCKQVKLPKKENFESKEKRFLSEDEIQRFKETALSMRKKVSVPLYEYGCVICLIIYTGLRVGELCALKWQDIDFENKSLKVSKSIGVVYKDGKRTLCEQPTKSGKTRFVPLNDKAIGLLEKQKNLVNAKDDDYIVNGSHDIVDKTIVANTYPKICRRAEIPNPSGIHTLRHTFASLALLKGVDVKVVSEILGHSSVNFTYNTYIHIIEQQKINAVDLLNNI